MKKTYIKPTTFEAHIQQQGIICNSKLTNTNGNADLEYEGAGDGTDEHGGKPRSRQYNVWDDEEE